MLASAVSYLDEASFTRPSKIESNPPAGALLMLNFKQFYIQGKFVILIAHFNILVLKCLKSHAKKNFNQTYILISFDRSKYDVK